MAANRNAVPTLPKFRMPTTQNLIPMRIDVEVDGRRWHDSFTWDANEPDTEVVPFVKRMVKEEGLPSSFIQEIVAAMQTQLSEFNSITVVDGPQDERLHILKLAVRVGNTVIHDQLLWDLGRSDGDPEAFARGLCRDLNLQEPAVAPAVAFAIREQILEVLRQASSSRDSRSSSKEARRNKRNAMGDMGLGATAVSLMRRANNKRSVVRRKSEWELFEPVLEILSDKEVEALNAQEEIARKRRKDELMDSFRGGLRHWS